MNACRVGRSRTDVYPPVRPLARLSVRPSVRLSDCLPIPPPLRLHVQVVIAGFHHCGAVTEAAGATPRVHVPGLRAWLERARARVAWFVEIQ